MWFSKLIMMTGNVYENCIIMYSKFLKGKILHFSPQEGSARASGGSRFNCGELMCKT